MLLNICAEQCITNCHCDSSSNEAKIVNIFSLGWTRRQIFKPPGIPQILRRTWQSKHTFCQEHQITNVWSFCHLTLCFSKIQSTWCNYKQSLHRELQSYFYFRQIELAEVEDTWYSNGRIDCGQNKYLPWCCHLLDVLTGTSLTQDLWRKWPSDFLCLFQTCQKSESFQRSFMRFYLLFYLFYQTRFYLSFF